jgi:2-methylcitrate dehydratase PrpD
VERIVVELPGQRFYDVVSRPFSIRNNPTVDGQFSMPYTVASAIIDGYVALDTFAPDTVKEKRRKHLADRVDVRLNLPVEDKASLGPVKMHIRKTDGGTVSETVAHFLGSPQHPMNRDACIDKFMRCMHAAGNPFPEKVLKRVFDWIFNLESVEDAAEVLTLLTRRD